MHLFLPSDNGGDPSWIESIANAPEKLQSILEMNAILAHQPWLLTEKHIDALVSPGGKDQVCVGVWVCGCGCVGVCAPAHCLSWM
jgi:hypothetical protein